MEVNDAAITLQQPILPISNVAGVTVALSESGEGQRQSWHNANNELEGGGQLCKPKRREGSLGETFPSLRGVRVTGKDVPGTSAASIFPVYLPCV